MAIKLRSTPAGKVKAKHTLVPEMDKVEERSLIVLKQAYSSLMGRTLSDSEYSDIKNVERIINGRYVETEDVEAGNPCWCRVETIRGERWRLVIHPVDKMRLRREYGAIFTALREQATKDIWENMVNAAKTLSESINNSDLAEVQLRDKAYVLDVVSRNMENIQKIVARSGGEPDELTQDDVVTLEETIVRRLMGSPAAIQKLKEKANGCL